ncbi:dTDP-4-dehydrorhamnose reductase [Terriglobus saanensis]|uniref:dTDP-4-dehydrorhamnose reductase n=1 Tax=Terriglobus saanensis (strain ATCC BAA-1853 / DSM 23119 / SP1PR4) TaxID=401053 RepID=E8V2C3_TERSS|nr:dTDP-4-dehydrorhamnose reductase [Terriglobus saanensis]ADV81256.1 dTDP-4-dehydrorhamnose reductase [Terriglobus saanensis SP1PR4]
MNQNPSVVAQPLELWGGVEYTCNRVGESYFDQMQISGHAERVSDIERIAELGIKTLRYGLLWERHELDPSWRWSDERMGAMRQQGIRPIVSLVHHGSGPQHTSLLDQEFPHKLAAYAGEVAARYPWVDAYTPVNEPHTTARFSGLYALWYPHHQSRRSYLRALLNQTKATVLSMQAIRRVRPDAQLVQTDDLGRIWSTDALSATCDLLDERRWLPFDLLCGRVTRQHPLFSYMVKAGLFEEEILWFAANPCPPNTVGVNYYLTSDRYLDHRTHLYPRDRVSAEGPFVDVEAVRVRAEGIAGFGSIVTEAWQRYGIPVAVTEVHLGGDAREQMRWAAEAWTEISDARASGVDCRAMTMWALLGSFFWNSLVTCENGHYEAGAFDVTSGQPAPTALAEFIQQMASGTAPQHPALATQGWWRRDDRIHFPHVQGTGLAA